MRFDLVSLAALAFLASVGLTAAHAGEVHLKSGKMRRGTIVSSDDNFVVLETDLGRIRIARSEIARVVEDEVPEPVVPPPVDRPRVDPPEARPEPDAEPPIDPRAAARAAAEEEREALDAAERIAKRRATRIHRTTRPKTVETAPPEPKDNGATIGGKDLARVAPGAHVIVFQPPHLFSNSSGAIELGRRMYARMEMAGVSAAWLAVPMKSGDERAAIRLSDVKRHIEVVDDEARKRLLEGIGRGDWLQLRLTDDARVEGRLEKLEGKSVRIVDLDEEGNPAPRSVALDEIVQLDGLLHNSAAHLALMEVEDGEPIAVTLWPTGDEVLGRFTDRTATLLSLDTTGDGKADRHVARNGPLADVLRVPGRWREEVSELAIGKVVRAEYRDTFEDAVISTRLLARVAAVTAYGIAFETEEGAVVVSYDDLTDLLPIDVDSEDELQAMTRKIPADSVASEVPLLPGAPAEDGQEIDGLSTISDGRMVTHVFISPPFEGEVLGLRLGDPASHVMRRSDLRFDTVVTHRAERGSAGARKELLSDAIEGVRIALLVDASGFVSAIELSRTE